MIVNFYIWYYTFYFQPSEMLCDGGDGETLWVRQLNSYLHWCIQLNFDILDTDTCISITIDMSK